MEKLASNLKSEILPDYLPKDFYLCSVDDIDSLADMVEPSSKHFGLFLAFDAHSVESGKITQAAEKLLEKGLVYLCAWGPDCERVHDVFDCAALEIDPQSEKAVIMTTWHSDESLQEAIWFFINAAFPDDAYARTCRPWIFAPIGNANWEKIIQRCQPLGMV